MLTMDPLSITVSVSSLLVIAAQVIKKGSDIRSKYRDASFMLTSISAECALINTSLAMLQNSMLSDLEALRARMSADTIDTFDTALQSCALIMSVLDEEIQCLYEAKGDAEPKPNRVKYILQGDHLQELLAQIRGQKAGISMLLQIYQLQTTSEVKQTVKENNVLLRRIADRGQRYWRESMHENDSRTIRSSVVGDEDSIFDLSSIVDDRTFAFDDEIINAASYRRALAVLRKTRRGEEVIELPAKQATSADTHHERAAMGASGANTGFPRLQNTDNPPSADARKRTGAFLQRIEETRNRALKDQPAVWQAMTQQPPSEAQLSITKWLSDNYENHDSTAIGSAASDNYALRLRPLDLIRMESLNEPQVSSQASSLETGQDKKPIQSPGSIPSVWPLFSSAMPQSDSSDGDEHSPFARVKIQQDAVHTKTLVLFTVASIYQFNIDPARTQAGFPYLSYSSGEIFDIVGEKGELWLARNHDEPELVGWIWNKHFMKLAQDIDLSLRKGNDAWI